MPAALRIDPEWLAVAEVPIEVLRVLDVKFIHLQRFRVAANIPCSNAPGRSVAGRWIDAA